MKISSKLECGIVALIDIAINSQHGKTVSIAGISKRQNISTKYLEQILVALKQARLIRGQKGAGGGYLLSRPAEDIYFDQIINALDLTILSGNDNEGVSGIRRVMNDEIWRPLDEQLTGLTSGISLAQIAEKCAASEQEEFMYYI
ncbi:MAG: Rrf2 family transcriptional regulator [Ruminococcus sp.]|nr:Rrf2 family transcriptional regulator [Ruminococcus sp.]